MQSTASLVFLNVHALQVPRFMEFGQVEHNVNFPLVASLLANFGDRLPRKLEFQAHTRDKTSTG